MGSNYDCLLFYTEVRWLNRGKVLTQMFELRTEALAQVAIVFSTGRISQKKNIPETLKEIFTKNG